MVGLQIQFLRKETKISIAQQGSEYNNRMDKRNRQPSVGQEKMLVDSNYLQTEESMLCINFY